MTFHVDDGEAVWAIVQLVATWMAVVDLAHAIEHRSEWVWPVTSTGLVLMNILMSLIALSALLTPASEATAWLGTPAGVATYWGVPVMSLVLMCTAIARLVVRRTSA